MILDLAIAVPHGALARAALLLPTGVAVGFAYFGALAWNARLYVSGGVARAFAIQLGRFGVLVGILTGIAQFGAQPLLWTALGVVVGRMLVVRRLGRIP